MIIKKLELHGFKSFSERTRVVFHPGITAIIGPNGTGKSNIVDALLWTLRGRRLRSQKRGDRTGENIFNGNANIPPMSLADVAIVLGETAPTSDSEDLIINHRLFRSGENEYRLNGKATRLKDIQEALHQNAIGDTDYFVIEQGSVGLFVTSKPMEKRILLEEAAGTAYYKDKKRQAQNKLDNSQQNLYRLEDIIIEVEKSTNSLKRQAQAAIRYRKLREHIRELTMSVYRQRIEVLETSQRDAAEGYREKLDRENAITGRIKDQEKNLTTRRQEVWSLEKRLQEERDELYASRARHSRSESEKEREEKRVDFYIERKQAAEAGLAELGQEQGGLDAEQQEVEASLNALTAQLEAKQKALSKAERTLNQAQEELTNLEQRLDQQRADFLQKLSLQTEVKNDAARYEKELELTTRRRERLDEELKAQRAQEQEKADHLKDKEAELAEIRAEAEQAQNRLKELTTKRDRTRSRHEKADQRRQSLRAKLDKQTHHLHALEKLKDQELQAAETTDLPEALGQLADFIRVSDERAPLLDVFYKEEARAVLIKAGDLRKTLETRDLKGRFLLLHPEGHPAVPQEFGDDPRVLGMLRAQIEAEKKIEAGLSALGNAVIVQTARDAIDLWLGNPDFHYISLAGDLLLASGLMTLGNRQEGLISINRDITSLTREISQIKTQLSPVEVEISNLAQEHQELADHIHATESALASLRQREGIENNKTTFARSALEQTRTHSQLLENEMASISQESEEVTRRWTSATTQIDDLKLTEQELNNTIRDEERKLSTLRENAEQNRKTFFQLQSEVDLHKEKIENARGILQRLEQRDNFVSHKTKELNKEIQESEAQQAELKQRIHELVAGLGRQDRDIKKRESELAKMEAELQDRQNAGQELETQIRELREKHTAAEEVRVKWEISKAERERDLVNFEESCWQELKKTLQEIKSEIPLQETEDIDRSESELEQAKEKLQRIKAVNLMAEEEYLTQNERFEFLTKQRDDLVESIASTKAAINKIDQESKTQFLRALIAVNKNFQDVFELLFEGGNAQVKLTDEDDPLESGVEIVAQPPGKRVQNLSLLSGGEKTLTSLAFFFALFRYKPAPFCILDEVDAALDETNLTRFLNLMRNIKDQTQFIIITHNYKTMEVADYIYGTTMAEPNITSIYSVKMEDKVKVSPQTR
jgi:chromosome segregation protein